MRKVLVLIALILSMFSGFSQDYCKDIIVHSEETLDKVVASSPTEAIYFIRIDENDINRFYIGLQVTTTGQLIKGKNVRIDFEDGSMLIFKLENVDVYPHYDMNIDETCFTYTTFIALTEPQMIGFTKKKVVAFYMGSLQGFVEDSNKLMEYAKCLIENR